MDGAAPWLLAIDTATSRIVVAAGTPDGRLLRALDWPAGHRHGERLLPGVERLMGDTGLGRAGLAGIVVGTGPGAFTGLRVGLATAKTLAHALGAPIAGVGTGRALLRAAAAIGGPGSADPVLLLPAGPRDRVEMRAGEAPRLLPGGSEPDLAAGEVLVAVDLEARAPDDAVARGSAALEGLAAALVQLGAERLREGPGDDVAELVPEYVTLPRGVHAASGAVAWSHAPR
jgi:tRNA threonylcarbamoyladenosine biosynthesis protein TsaB